jgi:PPM family protein phosphatase
MVVAFGLVRAEPRPGVSPVAPRVVQEVLTSNGSSGGVRNGRHASVPEAIPFSTFGTGLVSGHTTMRLEAASATHPGRVRRTNEDALASWVPDDPAVLRSKGALFAVADGVGGQEKGEIASRAAVEEIRTEYYSARAPGQIESALGASIQAANLCVLNLARSSDRSGDTFSPDTSRAAQTTLTAFVLAGQQAYVGHVGDCRLYRLRDGVLSPMTGDHTEAAEMVRLRLITAEQAQTHPRRSVVTRVLGTSHSLRPDFYRFPVVAGDRFLLCTDGLWGMVEDGMLAETLRLSPDIACQTLVTLACKRGGEDNIAMHAVHVLELGAPSGGSRPGRIARLLSGLRGG